MTVQKFTVEVTSEDGVLDSDVQYTLNAYLRRECPQSGVMQVEVIDAE